MTQITKYTYRLFSSRAEDDVVLFLYDEKSDVVGEVRFIAAGAPLPPAQATDGKILLYFHRYQLPDVVDLLRNEGPVHLTWAGPRDTALATEYEPVGEAEAAAGGRRR